ncbi:MAG: aryl-sulfate sulfotransferase [bacterium]|nr:aryl-sulfate sulfotransferase [bacterium]
MTPALVRATATAVVGYSAAMLGSSALAQAPGLRIFQPIGPHQTQLVDRAGNVVHSWPTVGNLSAHIEANGSLVRSQLTGAITVPGATGLIEKLAFDGTVTWSYQVSGPFQYAHHDVEPMPNGNVLIIAWDRYTVPDAIAAGRDPGLITNSDWLPDAILEIQPTGPTSGQIVWEWHMMDHVIQDFDATKPNFGVVANAPDKLDINYPAVVLTDGDWNHFNGLDYDPVNDWIIVSSRAQAEIYLIDHSTTTAEAATGAGGRRGKGGRILYRWGNPEAYRAGTAQNQILDGQHDPRFIPAGWPGAGNVTVFNNRYQANQSAVHEITIPVDAAGNIVLDPSTGRYGPATPGWTFTEPNFFSAIVSSSERLPNGNTLICSGAQRRLFEVDSQGQTVWSFTYPAANLIFQTHYVDRTMWIDTDELSVSGSQVEFDHLTGTENAGQMYMLLGSISGTTPGTMVPGGVQLPLNVDFLTSAMVTGWNAGPFVDTIGVLDASGKGSSSVVAPPGLIPAALVGVDVDFAHLVYDATLTAVRASNPVRVTIVP